MVFDADRGRLGHGELERIQVRGRVLATRIDEVGAQLESGRVAQLLVTGTDSVQAVMRGPCALGVMLLVRNRYKVIVVIGIVVVALVLKLEVPLLQDLAFTPRRQRQELGRD